MLIDNYSHLKYLTSHPSNADQVFATMVIAINDLEEPLAIGVHFVGSINLPTTTDVFSQVPKLLPNRLRRLPDGETGKRDYFVVWQREVFATAPEVLMPDPTAGEEFIVAPPPTPAELEASLARLPAKLEAKYDTYALESYELFKQFKEEGNIGKDVKFQVCIPGPSNTLFQIHPSYQPAIAPRYEAALLSSMQKIQEQIPNEELAIQIDVAGEIGLLEHVPLFGNYYLQDREQILSQVARIARGVKEGVELGFHVCYGDIGHQHFVQPKDLGLCVSVVNELMERVGRGADWVHMPVPKDRTDEEYFVSLSELKRGEGGVKEVYIGLVHPGDLEGTKKRCERVAAVLGKGSFGVGTECGMGRTPKEEFDSILEIMGQASGEV